MSLRVPAEWEMHASCWMAFPHLAEEWNGLLEEAQQAIASLACSISMAGEEPVRLLVASGPLEQLARNMCVGAEDIEFVRAVYGDCWTRDTAPIFGWQDDALVGAVLRFNGWGEKFQMPGDNEVADAVLGKTNAPRVDSQLVGEGGALEFDGEGTCITTRSCLLNSNRNPNLTRADIETELRRVFDLERVVWLDGGLAHDHTDGHVDMVARFTAPGEVVCMQPEADDPNRDVLEAIANKLLEADLRVHRIPSPGRVLSTRDQPLPGSYCNFYIANAAVIVPTYGVPADAQVLDIIGDLFPDRRVVGQPARNLLSGGGALHCVTQPEPLP